MARLAKDVQGFQGILNQPQALWHGAQRWLVRNNLWREPGHGAMALNKFWISEACQSVVTTEGKSPLVFVRIRFCASSGGEETTALVRFRKRGSSVSWDVLPEPRQDQPITLETAVSTGKLIVLGGFEDWSTNWKHISLEAFKFYRGRWTLAGTLTTENESWFVPQLKLNRRGDGVLPIRMITRECPEHLDASHGTSDRTLVERWTFEGGHPHADPVLVQDTA